MNITPDQLHLLLFPQCNTALDEVRGHFIRRNSYNSRAYAIPVTPEIADGLKTLLDSGNFYLQTINADGLLYKVLWDRVDWEQSFERRMDARLAFLANDIASLRKRAEERRRDMIVDRLCKLQLFHKQRERAVALATRLLDGTEEQYYKAAGDAEVMLSVIAKVSLYIPLDPIIKELDTRKLHEAKASQVQSDEAPDTSGAKKTPSEEPARGEEQTGGAV